MEFWVESWAFVVDQEGPKKGLGLPNLIPTVESLVFIV